MKIEIELPRLTVMNLLSSKLKSINVFEGNTILTVIRTPQTIEIKVPEDLLNKMIESQRAFVEPRYTAVVGSLGSADKGINTAIKVRGKIKSIGSITVNFIDEGPLVKWLQINSA